MTVTCTTREGQTDVILYERTRWLSQYATVITMHVHYIVTVIVTLHPHNKV